MLKHYILGLLFFSSCLLFAQQYTISGYIEDGSTGEKLIAANIYDNISGAGAVTNTYGFFSLTLPADSVDLSFSYIGYQSVNEKFLLNQNRTLNISLSSAVELTTIEVTADRTERIEQQTQMSRVEVPVEQIKRIPALLGEVDVLKALQLLPGVQSGGEGQNGLYVRGGSPDQNLVLLDGVPVYNVSHLLGIFSVFNADAIKNVTLTKGGFPARYGGRLSSVLEINMNEGNLQEWHGEGSIGLISSKLTLQGPIQKGKTSFLVSARRTYADLIFKPIIKASTPPDEKIDVELYFYDLNAKIQHKINDKHRIFLSAYTGADVFSNRYEDEFGAFDGGIDWGNLISAARWNWQISPKLFANTTLTYSKYEVDINAGSENFDPDPTIPIEKFSALYVSGIEDVGGKIDFDFIPNPKHYIRFGGGWTNHTYRPGALNFKLSDGEDFNLDTLLGSQNNYSNEMFLYAEDDFTFGALKINAGIHASAFAVEDEFYTSVQPRLGLRYLLDNDLAIKAGFSTMTQYINLLTSEALSLPTDLWVPSTARIKPQQSWQIALGAAKTIKEEYELSIEGYYKEMNEVISFKEGASFLFGLENDWQSKVTQGDGESYGLELFFQKKRGRTTGWIGYTLSWNWRQFDEINSGNRFPFRYDRRHDLSVVVNHDFTDKIGLSAAWVYGTGNAVTLNTISYPNSALGSQDSPFFYEIETGGEKNAYRMSNYHRMDVSIEFRKKKPKWERKWVIGVYNAYYHRNPYYILADTEYIRDSQGQVIEKKPVFKEISILPIIPSVSYQFKF